MASQFSLHISHLSSGHVESVFEPGDSMRYKSKWTMPLKYAHTRNNHSCQYLLRYTMLSQLNSVTWYKPKVVSAMPSSDTDQPNAEDDQPEAMDIEYNRIDCLVCFLHEAARRFLVTIHSDGSARRYPELAMAWIGVDVYSWHKKVAYQVAVYALLKAVIEVELFLSQKRHTDASVSEILYPTTSSLGECIEDQLNLRSPNLVHWFKTIELPRLAGLFIPLFKKWSVDYAGSGVAGIILAISSCIAVRKLGSGRLSCPALPVSIENILARLMNSSYTTVSVGKLHHLAIEAGFEEEFLSHFGTKILPNKNNKEIKFWIGLVQTKLSVAFHREGVISGKQVFCDKDQVNDLAILGLFAFLGKQTRLFFSRIKIKDLEEQVVDFLSYLEYGSLFVYPKFSSMSEYQLFMEVVTDEIGWLDLDIYAEYYCKFCKDKRRSKKRLIQAKKEIILNMVLTIYYDVFAGLAHYMRTTQRDPNSDLHAFLLRSQNLLSLCLEDFRAAYNRSGVPVQKIEEGANKYKTSCKVLDSVTDILGNLGFSGIINNCAFSERKPRFAKSESIYASLPSKLTSKLISASTAIWIGTQLFCADVFVSIKLVIKQLQGKKVTKRERKKIKRTLTDIAKLVLVTILLLNPVSLAHAAMLIAIKRYIPALIPSSYSSESLNMVKQLKEMKIKARSATEDADISGEASEEINDDESSSMQN